MSCLCFGNIDFLLRVDFFFSLSAGLCPSCFCLNLILTSLIFPHCVVFISVSVTFGPLVSGAFHVPGVFLLCSRFLEEPGLFWFQDAMVNMQMLSFPLFGPFKLGSVGLCNCCSLSFVASGESCWPPSLSAWVSVLLSYCCHNKLLQT